MSALSGLENTIAAETVLSEIDGQAGQLLIAGLPLEAVVQLDFAQTAHLLWAPFMPANTPAGLSQELGAQRRLAHAKLQPYAPLLQQSSALVAERLALELTASESELQTPAGQTATLTLGLALHLNPSAPEPDPSAEHVADLLRLLQGNLPEPAQVKALSTYLQTVAEHGLNASTFTARVMASTQTDLSSCLIGAIGALKGPLHGGAPGPVLDMLDAIGSLEQAQNWLDTQLAHRERIMGFGHRVYRSRDPRAEVLKDALKTLQAQAPSARLDFAEALEAQILARLAQHKPERPLQTNVEYYTALLLEALGFARQDFTAVFAIGRVLGWCAHVLEQRQSGRLLRPRARYIGPRLELSLSVSK